MSEIVKLLPPDIFEEVYVAFVNLIVTDPFVKEITADNKYVFDFLPFESIKAVYTELDVSNIPADTPHITVHINRMAFAPATSCSKAGEIAATIVYESPMLQNSTYKLASYLSSMLSIKVFPCRDRSVRVTSSAAQFTYNSKNRSVSVQQDVTLLFEINARL